MGEDMPYKIMLLAILMMLTACSLSSNYVSSGPCKGFHVDQQACQRAAENSVIIGKINIGQSLQEVRKIMGKDPERREATADSETWEYLTDYMAHLNTVIIFKNGLVVEIKQVSSEK
jgi:hypothetical protein